MKRVLITAALALAASGVAEASTLYGASYTGGPQSNLYSVDQSTGALTLIGNTGRNLGDLTSIDNSLVGVDLSSNTLHTLDTATGAASGGLAITGTQGVITSIAWDPVSRALYGNTTSGFGGADTLYRIDTGTGAATLIGALGFTNVYALGFGQDGALFGVQDGGDLLSISIATGAAASIGSPGFGFIFDIAARPEDNVLFGATSSNYSLLTLNKTTGAGTVVGGYGASANIAGLAFIGEGGVVPEPSTWALMIGGFASAGAMLRRRRAFAA